MYLQLQFYCNNRQAVLSALKNWINFHSRPQRNAGQVQRQYKNWGLRRFIKQRVHFSEQEDKWKDKYFIIFLLFTSSHGTSNLKLLKEQRTDKKNVEILKLKM